MILKSCCILLLALCFSCNKKVDVSPPVSTGLTAAIPRSKARTIITTDGEIDDVDSFIRMLLYANEFDIEGLIYSSSMWHYKGDGKGTTMVSDMEMTREMYGERTDLRWPGENWMQELIEKYAEVYPSLSTHANGYPTPENLLRLVRVGNIDFEGEMDQDTEGSDFIKAKLLENDPTPIYLQVWGGTNTIARSLKSIQDEYQGEPGWEELQARISQKTILYTILDQDATYRDYIEPNWPDIRLFYNSFQFACLAYPWKRMVPDTLQKYLEGKFMGEHIINNHGLLTKAYYSYGDGQHQVGDDEHIHGDPTRLENAQWGSFGVFDFISEGDSPAFLHLVDVGLGNLDHPEYGGWGGRLVQSDEQPNRWEDGPRATDLDPYADTLSLFYAQTRWLEALQNDFAARADWCVQKFDQANHPPIIELLNARSMQVRPGTSVTLSAAIHDPDGDEVNLRWWRYQEVDTYTGSLPLLGINTEQLSFTVPDDLSEGQTLHIILEATDQGEPALTRYERVVLRGI